MARPTIYSAELSEAICARLSGGESLRSICAGDDMPALSTVLLWVVDGKHKEFSEHYAQAREANGHAHGDRVADLAADVLSGTYEPQAAKVAIDALKWSAERMASKQYGAKQQHEVAGKNGGAIEVANMTEVELGRRIAFALSQASNGSDA